LEAPLCCLSDIRRFAAKAALSQGYWLILVWLPYAALSPGCIYGILNVHSHPTRNSRNGGDALEPAHIEKVLNQVLKDLFYKILRIQEKAVAAASNRNLSRTEMHVLEIVEDVPNVTLTQIAETLGISVTIARLEKKKYLEKVRLDEDKRKSLLKLTDQGLFCYEKHRQFHEAMVQSLLMEFKIDQYPTVIKSLEALLQFFNDAYRDKPAKIKKRAFAR
jgi:DNA-binding MarR family transcriptional regulator